MSYARYAVYDLVSGRIDRVICCPIDSVVLSCQAGEGAVQVDTEQDSTHYVDNTHYVVPAVLVPFPGRPSPAHVWDWASKEWTL